MPRALLWIPAGLAGLWLLDRLFLWMERRGWIFYRRRKPNPASVGGAFLQLQQLVQPSARHVIEARQRERADQEDAAGPDTAGADHNAR